MAIQRFAELTKMAVNRYPFQNRLDVFYPVPDGYTVTQYDVDVLERAIGNPANIEKVELFLRTRCGFAAERELYWLTWPKIVAIVRDAIGELPPAPQSSGKSAPAPEKLPGKAQTAPAAIQRPTSAPKRITKEAGVDPDLQVVIERWPTVSKDLRKAILRMIDVRQNQPAAGDARQTNLAAIGPQKHQYRRRVERKREMRHETPASLTGGIGGRILGNRTASGTFSGRNPSPSV